MRISITANMVMALAAAAGATSCGMLTWLEVHLNEAALVAQSMTSIHSACMTAVDPSGIELRVCRDTH